MLRDAFLRLKDFNVRNRTFLAATFGTPAVLGSAASFIIGGGVLYSIINIGLRNISFTRDRNILLISSFFLAYLFFQVVSSLVNSSLVSDLGDLSSNIAFLSIPILYSFISTIDKDVVEKASVVGCAISCVAAFVVALFEFYGQNARAEAGAGNPIVFGMMVGLAASIVFAAALSMQGRQRHLLFVIAAAGTVAMFLSGTKIMWVALAACVVILLLVYREKLAFRLTRAKAAIILCGVLVFGGLAFEPVVSRTEHFMRDITTLDVTDKNAVSYRIAVWKVGVNAFLEKPMFGHGVGATKGIIERGLDREIGKPLIYTHFHNGFLTALVETGVFGAISLYGAFVAVAWVAIRSQRAAETETEKFGVAMLLVTVATYMICGTVGILVGHDIIDMVLLLTLVVATYLAAGRTADWISKPANPSPKTA